MTIHCSLAPCKNSIEIQADTELAKVCTIRSAGWSWDPASQSARCPKCRGQHRAHRAMEHRKAANA
jgi:hypothetical protein